MPRGRTFFTAYRRFLVETWLARGLSLDRIAGRLGCERRQLVQAIYRHDLKPRELLERRHG